MAGCNYRSNYTTMGTEEKKKDEPNIPGPQELPDQQKVGEDSGKESIKQDKETGKQPAEKTDK
jgi:hypothetical protein